MWDKSVKSPHKLLKKVSCSDEMGSARALVVRPKIHLAGSQCRLVWPSLHGNLAFVSALR